MRTLANHERSILTQSMQPTDRMMLAATVDLKSNGSAWLNLAANKSMSKPNQQRSPQNRSRELVKMYFENEDK